MKKIKVEPFTTISCKAICDNCDFSPGIWTYDTFTPADVRKAVLKHIRKTGHAITIEIIKATRYSLESQSNTSPLPIFTTKICP